MGSATKPTRFVTCPRACSGELLYLTKCCEEATETTVADAWAPLWVGQMPHPCGIGGTVAMVGAWERPGPPDGNHFAAENDPGA